MDETHDVAARVDGALRQAAHRAYAAAHGALGEEPDVADPPRWRWAISPRVAVTLAVVVAIIGALVVWAPRPGAASVATREISQPAPASEAASSADAQGVPASAPVGATEVSVHVVGAVMDPGVYQLPLGSRATDAIAAAGGPTEDAQLDSINLARPLNDGEQLRLLTRHEAESGGGVTAGGRININTAGSSQLEELPGVGPVLAERIVAYREQHGPFASVTALEGVAGLGSAIVAGLADSATV